MIWVRIMAGVEMCHVSCQCCHMSRRHGGDNNDKRLSHGDRGMSAAERGHDDDGDITTNISATLHSHDTPVLH